MYGPLDQDFVAKLSSANNFSYNHGSLAAGRRYRVLREFTDFAGSVHPVGETWTFRGSSFVPYDDGLTLYVSLNGENDWSIPMQWVPEEQGPILDAFAEYVAEA